MHVSGDRGLELRPLRHDEVVAFTRGFRGVFGGEADEPALAQAELRVEPDRSFLGLDRHGEVAATAGAYSFRMTLPGGSSVGCAGITSVSVRADHRRRGVLSALMDRLLTQARHRGDAVAALWASEAPIYGRYGFGPAVPTVELELRRVHAALHDHGALAEVELIDTVAARAAFPALRAAVAATRPGMLDRPAAHWDAALDADPVAARRGAGPRRHALLPGRGYAIHRLRPGWTDNEPTSTVVVEELHALDAAAHAALWRFVTDVDLATTTVAVRRPVDDPVLALLLDPVRARISADWPLQVRLVDLAAVLDGRRYTADGTLVLEVTDRQLPDQAGRWELTVTDGHGRAVRTDRPAALHLDTRELATVVLGGVRMTQLAAAGRVAEMVPGTAARLDAMMVSPSAPWHEAMF